MRYLLIVGLVIVSAIGVTAVRTRGTAAVVDGAPVPTDALPVTPPFSDTPVGVQLAWTLAELNGGAASLTEAEVAAHVSPALLTALPPALLVGAFQQLAALRPFTMQGLTRPPTATQATALLTNAGGIPLVLPIAVEPAAPARVIGFTLTPVPSITGVALRPFMAGSESTRSDGLVEIGGRQLYLSYIGRAVPRSCWNQVWVIPPPRGLPSRARSLASPESAVTIAPIRLLARATLRPLRAPGTRRQRTSRRSCQPPAFPVHT